MEAHLPSRRGAASTSGGPTTSQAAAEGDTSHSRPAACDVALEVSWGRTGSPGWYPVLGVRLCAKHRGTKILGRGPCPQGTLGLVAENTPTLSIPSQHTHPRPGHITSSISHGPASPPSASLPTYNLLTLGRLASQTDLKPPSYTKSVLSSVSSAWGPGAAAWALPASPTQSSPHPASSLRL